MFRRPDEGDNGSDDQGSDLGDPDEALQVLDPDQLMERGRASSPVTFSDHPHHHYAHNEESRFHRPSLAKGHIKGGFLSDMHPEFGHHSAAVRKAAAVGGADAAAAATTVPNITRPPAAILNSHSASASALHSDALINKLTRRGSTANLEKSALLTAQSLAAMALNKPQPSPAPIQHLARMVSSTDVKTAPLPPMRSTSQLKDPKDKGKRL